MGLLALHSCGGLIRFKVVGGTRRVEVLEKQERHGRSASALRTKTARELWSAIQARLSRAQETIANLSGAEARAKLSSLETELELFEEYLRAESIKGLIPIDSELASALENARRELSTTHPSPEAALSALRSRTAAALGNAEKSRTELVDGLLVDAVGLEDARWAPVLDAIKRAKEEKVLTGLLEAATAQQNLIRGWVEQLSTEYSAPDPALRPPLRDALLQRLGYVQAQAALNPTEARRTLRGIREDALKVNPRRVRLERSARFVEAARTTYAIPAIS